MRIFLSKKFHSVTVRVFTGKFKCQISLIVRLFPSIVSMTVEDFSTYIRKWHKKNLKKKKKPWNTNCILFFYMPQNVIAQIKQWWCCNSRVWRYWHKVKGIRVSALWRNEKSICRACFSVGRTSLEHFIKRFMLVNSSAEQNIDVKINI